MATKVIIITLAFTVLSGTLALAQGSKPRAANNANVHAMNLDRCPYYPSPIVCRDASQAREPGQWGHETDGR